MPYTKTISGKSKKVTITGVAQSLQDLIGEAVDGDANRVILSWIDGITGANPVAWITEDPAHTLVSGDGDVIYAGAQIEITWDNFKNFKIVKDGGSDFEMWIKQMDFEQDRT
jgi:hypothetical protein